MREEIIATIPQDDAEATLEVALVQTDANDVYVELRHMAWGSGLGWYRQKTLRLEASTAHSLLRALGQTRHRLMGGGAAVSGRKVIPFPDVDAISAESKRRAI